MVSLFAASLLFKKAEVLKHFIYKSSCLLLFEGPNPVSDWFPSLTANQIPSHRIFQMLK